jgi:4-hydroxybenzoate polyprenyltransferase
LLLGDYLRLVRLPNIFTVPSNILSGYFALVTLTSADALQLVLVVSSSVLLYTSGLVFNDYFDIETDIKERPYRPLPSGRISKRIAFTIAVSSIIFGNLIAYFAAGQTGLAVSSLVSAIIISYDYKLKKTKFGPIAMGLARSINVVLGASPAIYLILQNNNLFARMAFICLFTFAYILSISLLSRKEVQSNEDQKDLQKTIKNLRETVLICFSIIFCIIGSLIFLVVLGIFRADLLVNLVLFLAIIITVLFRQAKFHYSSSSLQNAVKNMVIAIIVFDSMFISGVAGLYYGLPVLTFLLPAIFLSRRLYVT